MKSLKNHLISTDPTKNILSKDPIFRSSAIFPFIINQKIKTNILFLGYWLIKRDIKEVSLVITLRDKNGKLINRKINLINVVKAFKISVYDLIQHKNKKNLTGSIELEVFSSKDMIYPYPAFTVNYEGENTSSVVHTCGRVYNNIQDLKSNNKIQIPESGFDISDKKNYNPFFSFVNGPSILKNEKILISLINYKGERKKKLIKLKKIMPYETLFINFINQKEKKFFKEKKGTARIKHNFKSFYPRFLAGNFDKKFFNSSITHTYYDLSNKKDSTQYWNNPDKKLYYNSSIGVPLFRNNGFFTELAIYPNFVKINFELGIEVFDDQGKKICHLPNIFKIKSSYSKPNYLNLNEIILVNKIKLDKKKNYFCRIYTSGENKILARLKFGLNVGNSRNTDALPSNICFNVQVPNLNELKKKGTFKWGPLQNKSGSEILLSNISFVKKNYKQAKVTLKFWNEFNGNFVKKKIIIPDCGNYRFILNKDKKIKSFLKNKTGWITVQSDNPFVNGWYFEFSKNRSVGGDHLF